MGYIVLGILVFLFDIITKYAAEMHLRLLDTIPLLKGVFHLTYVENRGIAFGLFSGERVIFIVVTVLVLAMLVILYAKTEKTQRTRFMKYAMALILGGATGNLLERLVKGYVVDFLDFRLIHFPVFNVADIAVCLGAGLLMIHFFLTEDKEESSKEGEASDE